MSSNTSKASIGNGSKSLSIQPGDQKPIQQSQNNKRRKGSTTSTIINDNTTNDNNRNRSRKSSATIALKMRPALSSSQIDKDSSSSIDVNNPGPEVVDAVARHLVSTPNDLKLQGGDITRDLYKWTNEHPGIINNDTNPNINNSNNNNLISSIQQQPQLQSQIHRPPVGIPNSPSMNNYEARRKRSMSFSAISITSLNNNNNANNNTSNNIHGTNKIGTILPGPIMTPEEMRAPGGFRRSFILQKHRKNNTPIPNFFTRNFIEFLTLYGHFAGEDLSESEEEEEEEENEVEEEEQEEEAIESERTSLISYHVPSVTTSHKSSTFKAILLLLKSFVGTGVLFLPKAFHNGGWAFSSLCLLLCAIISYWCFLTLIVTKDKIHVDGYGDMGERLYGHPMKLAILWSIVLSQIGFSAAYTVFTATNLKVFVENVLVRTATMNPTGYNLVWYIILQQLIFIPLSLTRKIAKLSGTALIADLFILLGLIYVYYYSSYYILSNGIASESMLWLNKADWSLFIGTAIFTFEGIGLLIPIQESMQNPQVFPKCLSLVMCIVTIIFISCGLICYSAFGEKVETVVLLNFPQDSAFTLMVQLLYSLAILLSTPLQLFPAIKILENWTFPIHASGKHNSRIKWKKNYFRCIMVIFTAMVAWVGANDLDKFVSLVGSFACIPLIYIYPPLLHFKAFLNDTSKTMRFRLGLDMLVFVFGIIIMVYTSWETISMWVH
ncbi:Avt3p NDAI_0C03790 [Naumovozyma dairenensis CBS 421]|uniref:Amino acid transporter transmembrane domain-containing protein n=1 Tax=Naumovozyma dairenensis (strain ATCC 10597 / BCRC 20456 / CBS 421 / NBRC 0211 / NRRL Y-12639) TaxID=1071378 RepID=G0W8C8_NAUDC|nr:hypothetical protein NDAI_0C03790 [Naumovozyma dairenensis CBS 421]CCD24039.1 hypothetical protein NDAI_0C03790 [Naumovozyma dairenensis CBS 421]